MIRKLLLPMLLLAPLALGCAGPDKLAEKSGDKLAEGRLWQAWTLATRALDKAPGNANARAAAQDAAAAIATDWQRRIHSLAAVDSMAAAEQVLEFTAFRADAARYTTVPVAAGWPREEQALRSGAAQAHYAAAQADLAAQRPKSAWRHFQEADRFVAGYRDVAALAARAREQALTRVAIVPLRSATGGTTLGRDVAASWRGDLVEHLPQPGEAFTLLLPVEDIERAVRVADLGRISRDAALRLGRKAGADRVVWGSLGTPESKTGLHLFSDRVARRVVAKDAAGRRVTRWVGVPLDVIARTRTVEIPVEYEIISTRDGSTLARHSDTRRLEARVVWTSYTPEGAPDTYALVSDEERQADPERAKKIETRWRAAVGDGTTLAQVIEARRSNRRGDTDRREVIARFMAGAAFVFLEDLPSTEELAFGAAAGGWEPLRRDLVRLDGVDDVDLGVAATSSASN